MTFAPVLAQYSLGPEIPGVRPSTLGLGAGLGKKYYWALGRKLGKIRVLGLGLKIFLEATNIILVVTVMGLMINTSRRVKEICAVYASLQKGYFAQHPPLLRLKEFLVSLALSLATGELC